MLATPECNWCDNISLKWARWLNCVRHNVTLMYTDRTTTEQRHELFFINLILCWRQHQLRACGCCCSCCCCCCGIRRWIAIAATIAAGPISTHPSPPSQRRRLPELPHCLQVRRFHRRQRRQDLCSNCCDGRIWMKEHYKILKTLEESPGAGMAVFKGLLSRPFRITPDF